MTLFKIDTQDRQNLYEDIAQALAPIFNLSAPETLGYQATTIPDQAIDAILGDLNFDQFDIGESDRPEIITNLKSALASLAIDNLNNLQDLLTPVMTDHLDGDGIQVFLKLVEGGLKKILVPRQIALAVSEPVATRVEEWLQRLVNGLQAQNIPTSFSSPSLLGQELDLQMDKVESREVIYASDQE